MGKNEDIIKLLFFYSFFIAFITAIVLFIQQYRRKKKEHHSMLQTQKEEHQRELMATQIEIQRQTMQHIGREIHDNIGQKLTLASLYTQQLAYENKAPQINGNIENISAIINQSLSELRELSKSLTDNTIDSTTISKLLEEECHKINDLKICSVAFDSNAKKVLLSYQSKSVLLRITQEFIQNSIKHSKCDAIAVDLYYQNNVLKLTLKDNGSGFDTSKKSTKGIGLNNMKKRTEIIGGTFDLTSTPSGTKLVIEMPL